MSPKLEMLRSLCNQTLNLETDAKTLSYSTLKLDYSLSIHLKHKKDCIFKQQLQKTHKQDILLKNLQIDQSFFASHGTHFMDCFVSLRILMGQGCRTQRYQNPRKTMVNVNNGPLNMQTFLSGL